LKYAIAVLLREKQDVIIWRGRDRYSFYVSREDFRGSNYGFVRMKKETYSLGDRLLGRPSYHKLPFTTELGKNWKLWQAFRELETNTRDEGGETYLHQVYNNDDPMEQLGCNSKQTWIAITGSRFVDEFHDMNRNFLPDGKVLREDEAIQVIDRPSNHIYYRGVRILDLKEESEFTYNFLCHVDLTEDRTAMHPFLLEMKLAEYIAEHEDIEFVGRAVNSRRYERNFNYGYASRPSVAFLNTASDSPNPTARQLVETKTKELEPSVQIIITVPKSEVTEDEREQIRAAVEEIFGTEITVKDLREAA
jgi:hypothetical protein